jgi:hypothetical protein
MLNSAGGEEGMGLEPKPAGEGPSLPPVRDRFLFGRAEDGCSGELEVVSFFYFLG